jgi:LysR family transcriptional activator of glutamate synthase operon
MTVGWSIHVVQSCVVDTDALRWFQLVADGTTVTEVAELEHLTQPGLSRALARLEREVGTPLLRRQGRTLRMTAAGSAFKRHVDAMLHELDDGLAAVEQLLDPETGQVRVSFERSMGPWLLPQLVGSFRAEHPGVSVLLRGGPAEAPADAAVHDQRGANQDAGQDVARLGRGEVDVALVSRRPRDPGTAWERLLAEPLVLVVRFGHPLATRSAVGLADVADEPFVALRGASPFRRTVDELLAGAGVEPDVAFEADDLATVQGFVAAGLGVAVVPASVAGERCEVVGLTDAGASRDLGLAWSTQRRLLPSAELFRDHVLQRARRGHLAAPFA